MFYVQMPSKVVESLKKFFARDLMGQMKGGNLQAIGFLFHVQTFKRG